MKLDVKTCVTFAVTIIWMYASIRGWITPDQIQNTFFMIVSFFFGTQYQKYVDSIERNGRH